MRSLKSLILLMAGGFMVGFFGVGSLVAGIGGGVYTFSPVVDGFLAGAGLIAVWFSFRLPLIKEGGEIEVAELMEEIATERTEVSPDNQLVKAKGALVEILEKEVVTKVWCCESEWDLKLVSYCLHCKQPLIPKEDDNAS